VLIFFRKKSTELKMRLTSQEVIPTRYSGKTTWKQISTHHLRVTTLLPFNFVWLLYMVFFENN